MIFIKPWRVTPEHHNNKEQQIKILRLLYFANISFLPGSQICLLDLWRVIGWSRGRFQAPGKSIFQLTCMFFIIPEGHGGGLLLPPSLALKGLNGGSVGGWMVGEVSSCWGPVSGRVEMGGYLGLGWRARSLWWVFSPPWFLWGIMRWLRSLWCIVWSLGRSQVNGVVGWPCTRAGGL